MINNNSAKLANLKMLELVANKLGDLCDEVVFLGGSTTALFITELGAPDVRSTLDVDCIVDVISLTEYYQFEKKLLQCGFKKAIFEEVLCRWQYDDLILDVMPTNENILGFGNNWYTSAIKNAINYSLTPQKIIKTVTAPYFIATKLEAFKTRGKMDYFASHDFEDVITLLDGRKEIIGEIKNTEDQLKNYLKNSFSDMQKKKQFHDALPGHFIHYGDLADDRIKLLLNRMREIINDS